MMVKLFYIVKVHKGPIAIVFNDEMFKIERSIFVGTLKECRDFIKENYGVVKTFGSIKKGLYTEGMLKVQ